MTTLRGIAQPSDCFLTHMLLAYWRKLLVFMGLLAGVTSVVHFCVLILSRQPEFVGRPWESLVFPFAWPSVVYSVDILAWDVFSLSMLFAALVFRGSHLAAWIRVLMIASGVLSLAGLSGVVAGDMQLRNIGIVGYVGVFLVVAALLAILFYRATPQEASHTQQPGVRSSVVERLCLMQAELTPLYSPGCVERKFSKLRFGRWPVATN